MCSIFGTTIDDIRLISGLAIEGESRGKDATGVAILHNNNLSIAKKDVKASEFPWEKMPIGKDVNFWLGHTRKTTKGDEHDNYNNHPFINKDKDFVLAHNGVINNDESLKKRKDLDDTKIETDSYVAVQLLDTIQYMHQKEELDIEIVKEVCELLAGSFALSILTKNKLYLLRHTRPLNIAYNGQDLIYASTQEMIVDSMKYVGKNNITSYINTFVGEIEDDTIYEFDLETRKFINHEEFIPSYSYSYTSYKTKTNVVDDKFYEKSSYYEKKNGEWVYKDKNDNESEDENEDNDNNDNNNDNSTNNTKNLGVITEEEWFELDNKEKLKFELCDKCGNYFSEGCGGYSPKTSQFLCLDCQEEITYMRKEEEEFGKNQLSSNNKI